MSGTDIAYNATRHSWQPSLVSDAVSLRACYAMSGTDVQHGATNLHSCYAMFGTDVQYGATNLRACYAMLGTDVPYAATRARGSLARSLVLSLLSPYAANGLCECFAVS
eukprot:178554-Rhodomonas_salina.1